MRSSSGSLACLCSNQRPNFIASLVAKFPLLSLTLVFSVMLACALPAAFAPFRPEFNPDFNSLLVKNEEQAVRLAVAADLSQGPGTLVLLGDPFWDGNLAPGGNLTEQPTASETAMRYWCEQKPPVFIDGLSSPSSCPADLLYDTAYAKKPQSGGGSSGGSGSGSGGGARRLLARMLQDAQPSSAGGTSTAALAPAGAGAAAAASRTPGGAAAASGAPGLAPGGAAALQAGAEAECTCAKKRSIDRGLLLFYQYEDGRNAVTDELAGLVRAHHR